METKGMDTNGGTSKAGGQNKAKLRKILYILCLVLLAIVAFRNWSRKAESGTAGQTASGAVTILADSEGGQSPTETAAAENADTVTTTAESPQEAAEAATAEVTPQEGAADIGWGGLNTGDTPLLAESSDVAATDIPPSGQAAAESPSAQAPPATSSSGQTASATSPSPTLPVSGQYTSKKDVALYIHLYGHLPDNFITKAEAKALGWGDTYSSVDEAAPGKSIGGDRFGNREGLLPKKAGRTYTECDIDTKGKKSRGAKRIVFSNDGLVYYTGDHYESFELLYGSE